MPYIDELERERIDPNIPALSETLDNPGNLNYAITRLATQYLLRKGLKYANINEVAGVLQKVLAEFDERVTRPYEIHKQDENGDIPEYKQVQDKIQQMFRMKTGGIGFKQTSRCV